MVEAGLEVLLVQGCVGVNLWIFKRYIVFVLYIWLKGFLLFEVQEAGDAGD